MRATRVQAGITEQHIRAVSPDQRNTTQFGHPFPRDKLEGHVGAVAQTGILPPIRDDKEAGIGWVQTTEVSHITNRLLVNIGPDHFAAQRSPICCFVVVTVGVAVTGISTLEGHIRADTEAARLNGWRVIVNGDHQRTAGRVVIAIGHRITDIQGDIVFSAADRVHQWFQQIDCISTGSWVGQHNSHQRSPDTADG